MVVWRREPTRLTDADLYAICAKMVRIVVAVDPSGNTGDGDACGIVVCGVDDKGHGYVLADQTISASPNRWAIAAIAAYHEFNADRIVYETNYGGAMIPDLFRTVDRSVPLKGVNATRGKALRAEPVSAMYEQGKVHHVGYHKDLEREMCQWVPGDGDSPNRLDAMVHGMTDLLLTNKRLPRIG